MNLEDYRRQAAAHAAGLVASGTVVGLGSGRTAAETIRRIGALLAEGVIHDVSGVPTSEAAAAEAWRAGIPLVDGVEGWPDIDLAIDGADEVNPALDLIKGAGGAFTREKVVARTSRRFVVVVDETKLSSRLGVRAPVPVEVIPFGWRSQARYLEALGARVSLRVGPDGSRYRSEQGNLVLDCTFGALDDAAALAARIQDRAGVVEHGLFLGLATDLVVAGAAGVDHRERVRAEVQVVADSAALARAAAEHIVRSAGEAIAARGRFVLALSGGSTPRAAYAGLALPPLAGGVDWERVHLVWGDERCVPPDHPDSNYRMAREILLDRVPIPPKQIHRIPGEPSPTAAAEGYERLLRSLVGESGIDLVLLGLGADGHTASLFPGRPAVRERVRWVVADEAGDGGSRITLTPAAFDRARAVLFLVEGADKAETVREVLEGPKTPDRLPAQAVRPARGRLSWLVDRAAGSRLCRVTRSSDLP
jgi:ribose 5-phosphate isomerase